MPSQDNKKRTARLALAGVMIALAFILSRLESLLPSFTGVPGIKAGLSNIVTMCALYVLDVPSAVTITIVRVLLAGITFTGMNAMLYSLAGSALSLLVMILLKHTGRFSVPAVSIAGGVAHNLGQILLARLMLGDAILYYFPVLVVTGSVSGLVIGILAAVLIPRLKKTIR